MGLFLIWDVGQGCVLEGLALPHGGRINIVKREDDHNWNDVFERERSRPKEMAQAAIGRRRYCL